MESKEAVGQVYNIGSNEEVSIEQLADKVIELAGSKSKKEFVPYEIAYGKPIEDMRRRVPCMDKIKKTVGGENKISLEESLNKIIDSFKNS
jgi:UDP-glucose 4-epimerase